MYKPPQKKNSSWTPSTVQKKGKSPSKLGDFSIQPKPNPSSASSQEIGEYSRDAADRLTANVMRSLQTREQEIAEESIQPKFQSPWAPTFEPPPPLPESPASKLKGAFASVSENPIQRQCAECAKEEVEQKGEERKDLEETGIQTKLTVGAPGDTYEQEADQVASQVMSMSAPTDSSASVQRQLDTNHPHHPHQIWQRAQSIKPVVQRQVDPRVQMRQMIQRAHQIDGNQASGDLESRLNASKGGGSPLSENVRGFMEPRFGADFSGVRVHTGGEAVQMNQELGAQAFTHGSDVYFGQGKEPGNNELTAHELTHVVQQTGKVQRQCDPSISSCPLAWFARFLNEGGGLTGHTLGSITALSYFLNAVELQFKVEPSALTQYRNLRPVQWAGPEVIYAKRGSPLTSPWQTIRRSSGTGWDNPEPENVYMGTNAIAYYDSPGPNVAGYIGTPTSRLYVVQNFTGWVVGEPLSGGGVQRLCNVAAWHSVVSLINENFDNPDAVPRWHRFRGNRSGTGWANTSTPPEY